MANLALISRPTCFAEVVGQEKAIDQILNYLNDLRANPDKRATPIILSGPRGTGKTTTGRLIAKYLNCKKQDNNYANPCDCPNCLAIMEDPDSAIDYLELDGASNNGVADIEAVIEITFYAPINYWKVILIDECHMLTKNAWNALLKQLEEPPLHVLYILATTEENRIIPTVKSRSKMRRFSLLDHETIVQHLYNIINNPNWVTDTEGLSEEVIDYIASMGKGSLRDAITFLGDVLDLSDRSLLSIQKSIGSADAKKAGMMLKHLFSDKLGEALILLHNLEKDGAEAGALMEQSQLMLTDLLNVKEGADLTRVLPVEYYKERFSTVNVSHVVNTLRIFLEVSGIARSSFTYVTLTYALVAAKKSMIQEPAFTPNTSKSQLTSNQTSPKYNPPSRPSQPTTSDKLSQLFQQRPSAVPPIKQPETSIPVVAVAPEPVKEEEEEESYF